MGDKEKDKSKEKAKDKGKEAQAKEKDKDKNKKKKKKQQMNYFEAFIDAVELSCLAAEMLQSVLENFDRSQIESQVKELHKIEHTADLEQHVVVEKLMHEFITPIDREDINRLSHEIDAVTDAVEEVLMNVYMYRIEEITPAANEMASLIVSCCRALKNAMEEFQNFPKTKMLHEKLVEVHDLEEQADRIYSKAVYELYGSQDPIKVLAWNQTYDHMESCCDACEHVANAIESVMMKNT